MPAGQRLGAPLFSVFPAFIHIWFLSPKKEGLGLCDTLAVLRGTRRDLAVGEPLAAMGSRQGPSGV